MEKKDIEDLSNLVFGLALTLGALTLVAPASDDLGSLLGVLLNFALSFVVIITIWWLYNTIMKRTRVEGRTRFGLNTLLLFLVVIEPFLLSITNKTIGSVAYPFDIGTILLILAAYNHLAIKEAEGGRQEVEGLRWSRNFMIGCALVFYASIAIAYIPELASQGIQGLVWLSVLLASALVRFLHDKRASKRTAT